MAAIEVKDQYRRLSQKLGHEFNNFSLVELALTHRSVGAHNNERLEFLGDSLLGCIIAEELFTRFPEQREGEMSQMRSQLVKGQTLAELAREFELGEVIKLGGGEMKSGGHRRESILADAVEALIAAIYFDAGMEQCKQRVLSWYRGRLDAISHKSSHKDAKTSLQEWLQGRKQALPSYQLQATTGDAHQQNFSVHCKVPGINRPFQGEGSTRRSAEQAAAAEALAALTAQHNR